MAAASQQHGAAAATHQGPAAELDLDGLAAHVLSEAWRTTSVCYATTIGASDPATQLDLAHVHAAFGTAGASFPVRPAPGAAPLGCLVVDEVTQELPRRNFVVVKCGFLSLNLSLKLYRHRYLQVFGLKDLDEHPARHIATVLVHFTIDALNRARALSNLPPLAASSELAAVSLSTYHTGVAGLGLGLDLDALESHLRSAPGPTPGLSRHPRNHSLIVSFDGQQGSQIFHSTGTTQLMGVREALLAPQLTALATLLRRAPHVVIVPLKKRRIRTQLPTARAKRSKVKRGATSAAAPAASAVCPPRPQLSPSAPAPASKRKQQQRKSVKVPAHLRPLVPASPPAAAADPVALAHELSSMLNDHGISTIDQLLDDAAHDGNDGDEDGISTHKPPLHVAESLPDDCMASPCADTLLDDLWLAASPSPTTAHDDDLSAATSPPADPFDLLTHDLTDGMFDLDAASVGLDGHTLALPALADPVHASFDLAFDLLPSSTPLV